MKKVFGLAACLATLVTGAATAQSIEPRGQAGGWRVFLNEATMGCFIQRETAQGIFLQIGTEKQLVDMSPDDPIGFLSVWLPGPAPANANPEELIVMDIGPNTYVGSAIAGERQDFHGATVFAQGSTLGFDLRNRRSMSILSTSGARVEIQLNASNISEALDALIECQSTVG